MTDTIPYAPLVRAAAPPANRGGRVMPKPRRRQSSKRCWSLTAPITTLVAIGLARAGTLADEAPRDREKPDVAAGGAVKQRLQTEYGLLRSMRRDAGRLRGSVGAGPLSALRGRRKRRAR